MATKLSNIVSKVVKIGNHFWTLIFSVFALLVLLVVAYFFAFNILRNPLSGNDAINAFAYTSWIDSKLPDLPMWYPLVGGGTSLVLGYPLLYSFVVIVTHNMLNIGLIGAMSVINFLTIVLPTFGVYLYVLVRFKSKLEAFIAGLFYLASPMSYVLSTGAGFLANSFALIFGPPLFLCLDLYLASLLNHAKQTKTIVYLMCAAVLFSLGMLAHPSVPMGFLIVFLLYAAIYGLLFGGVKTAVKAVGFALLAAVVMYGASYFYAKPLTDFTGFSNRDIGAIAPGDTSTFPPVELKGILGLVGNKPDYQYPFPNLSIVPLVWLSALAGLVYAIVTKNKHVVALSLVGAFSIYQTGTFTLWNIIEHVSPFLAQFVFNRYFYATTMVIIPILGGLGIVRVVGIPFDVITHILRRKTHALIHIPSAALLTSGAWACTFVAVGALAILLNPLSGMYDSKYPSFLRYGQEGGFDSNSLWIRTEKNPCDTNSVSYSKVSCDNPAIASSVYIPAFSYYCDVLGVYDSQNRPEVCDGGDHATFAAMKQLKARCDSKVYPSVYFQDMCSAFEMTTLGQLAHWPGISLPRDDAYTSILNRFSDPGHPYHFISQDGVRIDITPSLGTWVKEWPISNKSSVINAYTGQLVLNKSFNSFFMDTMYSQDMVKQPGAVDQLAHYFGISGIINTGNDQSYKFKSQGWLENQLAEGGDLWIPPFKTSLYTLETKPAILVIGSGSKQAYGQFFRAAAIGGVSYDDALLIEGKDKIDDYSLVELSKFSLVILHGYSYNSKTQAYSMLRDYLNRGGNVFVDTGWQYVAQDWGQDNGPVALGDPMPVTKTYWGDAGSSWTGAYIDSSVSEGVDLTTFAPLVWSGTNWSLAFTYPSDLATGAIPLVKLGDKIIMAQNRVGSGTVVWSGMNFIAHVRDSENASEIKLLSNIITKLSKPLTATQSSQVAYTRTPDKLNVVLTQNAPQSSFVYFRESYHPFWKASAVSSQVSKDLTIYLAGPRFMAVDVSGLPSGSIISFEFAGSASLLVPKLISILTVSILSVLLIDSLFGSKLIRACRGLILTKKNAVQKMVGNEDEGY